MNWYNDPAVVSMIGSLLVFLYYMVANIRAGQRQKEIRMSAAVCDDWDGEPGCDHPVDKREPVLVVEEEGKPPTVVQWLCGECGVSVVSPGRKPPVFSSAMHIIY